MEYRYAHFDTFKLILCRAEGTRYANFLEELVELEVKCSEEYYALLRKRGKLSGKMTKQLHHMITSAYFTAVCETIVHDMPKEEAVRYVEELSLIHIFMILQFLYWDVYIADADNAAIQPGLRYIPLHIGYHIRQHRHYGNTIGKSQCNMCCWLKAAKNRNVHILTC